MRDGKDLTSSFLAQYIENAKSRSENPKSRRELFGGHFYFKNGRNFLKFADIVQTIALVFLKITYILT